jgi:hypothetical protein
MSWEAKHKPIWNNTIEFKLVKSRAVELVHKTSDSHSSIFKTPTPTPS